MSTPFRARGAKRRLYDILVRESSSLVFIPEIDGLRFIAIMAVVLYHVNGFVAVKVGVPVQESRLSTFLEQGFVGVQLFFVLSGFIIALPFALRAFSGAKAPALVAYFTRRLSRLEPPYLVNLLILFLLKISVQGAVAGDLLPHLGASAVYQHNLVYGAPSTINHVAWSLEIELQFYVLAPLMANIFKVRSVALRRAVLALAIGAAAMGSELLKVGHPHAPFAIVLYAQYFLTGFLLVDVYLTDWKADPSTSLSGDVVSAAGWGSLIFLLYTPRLGTFLWPVAIFAAYFGAFRGTLSRSLLRRPLLVLVGGMCYTIYLYHFLVISAVGNPVLRAVIPATPALWLRITLVALVVVPAIVLSSAVMFILVEKPCMRRGWWARLLARLGAGPPLPHVLKTPNG